MKRIIILLVIALLIAPSAVVAQTSPSLSQLVVDLWPEYDRPSMLVIYHAVLSPQVSLPVELVFRIPTVAEKPHAVAVGASPEAVGDVSYNVQVSGEWLQVEFIATGPYIQFEYYDPRLEKDGSTRRFAYEWAGDYTVDSFELRVQQPLGASDMHLSPAIGQGVPAQDGFTYYEATLGSLAAGESFTLAIDYQKATDTLSSNNLPLQPTGPISPETPGRVNLSKVLPWVLGVLAVLLIFGGGWWYWQTGRQDRFPKERQRHKGSNKEPEQTALAGGVYCHQCGKRAEPNDRFCRWCGTHLRVD